MRVKNIIGSLLISLFLSTSLYGNNIFDISSLNGKVVQLTDTKTPYNTVMIDEKSKDILLWSFDIGEYSGRLDIETTILNGIFSNPLFLLASNKEVIV